LVQIKVNNAIQDLAMEIFFVHLQKYYNTLHLTYKILYKFASQSYESELRHHRSVEIIII